MNDKQKNLLLWLSNGGWRLGPALLWERGAVIQGSTRQLPLDRAEGFLLVPYPITRILKVGSDHWTRLDIDLTDTFLFLIVGNVSMGFTHCSLMIYLQTCGMERKLGYWLGAKSQISGNFWWIWSGPNGLEFSHHWHGFFFTLCHWSLVF